MSGFILTESGIAASFYLAVLTIFWLSITSLLFLRGWSNVMLFVWFYALFRLVSQICGVVFATMGPAGESWLIAYMVLGVEGYFMLIYSCFRFTRKAQVDAASQSWVLNQNPNGSRGCRRLNQNGFFLVYISLANALAIAGGSLMASQIGYYGDTDPITQIGSYLRIAGQSLFLIFVLYVVGLNLRVIMADKLRNQLTHCVLAASPFLIIRGVFGLMSIFIRDMDSYNRNNYSYYGQGINSKTVVYEYVLGVTMEFCVAALLTAGYLGYVKEHPNLGQNTVSRDSSDLDKASHDSFTESNRGAPTTETMMV